MYVCMYMCVMLQLNYGILRLKISVTSTTSSRFVVVVGEVSPGIQFKEFLKFRMSVHGHTHPLYLYALHFCTVYFCVLC